MTSGFIHRRVTGLVFVAALLSFYHTAWAAEGLSLGVHPYLSAPAVQERFVPLAIFLGGKLKRPVTVLISRNYEDHVEKVGQNMYDFAYLGSASYVEMVEHYGEKPILARLEVKGRPLFRGVIVVRKDSAFRSLSDLTGRRFAFGDPDSTMSSIIPQYLLLEAGIDLRLLGSYAHLGNHDNVALSILIGDFDAGGVKEEVFTEYEEKGLRALAYSPYVSEYLFVAGTHLPKDEIARIRGLMLEMKNDAQGRAVLTNLRRNATGLVPARDRDYDSLRRIMGRISLPGGGR